MTASLTTPNLGLPKFSGPDPTSWLQDFNGAMDILDGIILNKIYPVGTYYQTSDENFDPNVEWGGTWVEDTAGRFLVAKNDGRFNTVGGEGGEETHKLTVDEMPKHSHRFDHENLSQLYSSGQPVWSSARTSSADALYTTTEGGDQPHNNLPPYKVVKCWHRIA